MTPWRLAACIASARHQVWSPKGAEDSAGVKPASAQFAEDVVPVDFAWLELRDRRVAAVGAAQRRAHSEAALGEIEAVAGGASHAVVFHPANERLIHAALVDQVLQQTADGVVDKCRNDGGVQSEATLEPARHVVFAAAFVNVETARVERCAVRRDRIAASLRRD